METRETIFSLFFYSNLDIITEVGGVAHDFIGSDEEKMQFLESNVENDFKIAKKFPLPYNIKMKQNGVVRNAIDFPTFREFSIKGQAFIFFENIFNYYNANATPLAIITPVKNGSIFIEGKSKINSPASEFPKYIHVEKQKEWYQGYMDQEGFHLDNLINDDFFAAIKILFNSAHYVSAMKLLMICVDSMAYLEYDDTSNNFVKWLQAFAELDKLNITPEELWEFRNSILHMTNLDSRKVRQNKVARLAFFVSGKDFNGIEVSDEAKHFNFKSLMDIIAIAISKWTDTFKVDRNKFMAFLERYDRVLSDKNMTTIHYTNKFDKE